MYLYVCTHPIQLLYSINKKMTGVPPRPPGANGGTPQIKCKRPELKKQNENKQRKSEILLMKHIYTCIYIYMYIYIYIHVCIYVYINMYI